MKVDLTPAATLAATRYFEAERKFRRYAIVAYAAGQHAEREGAIRYAEWAHRAAVNEVKDPVPEGLRA